MAPQRTGGACAGCGPIKASFSQCYYAIVGVPSPGNDAEEVRLRALIAEHELDNVVHFLGEMEDTASVFAALDVAVVPSGERSRLVAW